jgi:hypothetical protein
MTKFLQPGISLIPLNAFLKNYHYIGQDEPVSFRPQMVPVLQVVRGQAARGHKVLLVNLFFYVRHPS